MSDTDTRVIAGSSGTVFADIGLPGAEEMLLKADLAAERMPTAFDRDVEIAVRPHARAGEGGRIAFTHVPA